MWLYLWWNRWPRAWGIGQTLLALLAALLIGVFVPMNLVAHVLPFGWLLNVTHNAQNILFVDQIGSAIGAYEFFGFPGLGLAAGVVGAGAPGTRVALDRRVESMS